MDPFIGLISAFGFNYAPYQWAICGGQLVAINQNTTLFSLLGVQYGGNGTSTFGLPNLNSSAAVGAGQSSYNDYSQGASGGAENATLTAANLPPHSHNLVFNINGNNDAASPSQTASGGYPANVDDGSLGNFAYTSAVGSNQYMAGVPTITIAPAGAGSGGTVAIRQPYLAICYCISLYGIFPSRAN